MPSRFRAELEAKLKLFIYSEMDELKNEISKEDKGDLSKVDGA